MNRDNLVFALSLIWRAVIILGAIHIASISDEKVGVPAMCIAIVTLLSLANKLGMLDHPH